LDPAQEKAKTDLIARARVPARPEKQLALEQVAQVITNPGRQMNSIVRAPARDKLEEDPEPGREQEKVREKDQGKQPELATS
jgi:hypothetical protein